MEWIIQLPVLFFSIILHEFCHGWVAYRYGDDTAALSGRLTFNPLPHIDPFGTIFLPLFCYMTHFPMFGWAKPVPVNSARLHNPSRDMVRVALVGPSANLALAVGAAILFKITHVVGVFTPPFQQTVSEVLLFAVGINLFLAFFNLLPVYPLDGSQVVSGLLPARLRAQYERHIPYGFFIILFLMVTGLLKYMVLSPSGIVYALLIWIGLIG